MLTHSGVTLIDDSFSTTNNSRGSDFSPSVETDLLIVFYTTKFLVEPRNRKQSLSLEKESSMQINLVLIFQIRTGFNYINVKMEMACTMFS